MDVTTCDTTILFPLAENPGGLAINGTAYPVVDGVITIPAGTPASVIAEAVALGIASTSDPADHEVRALRALRGVSATAAETATRLRISVPLATAVLRRLRAAAPAQVVEGAGGLFSLTTSGAVRAEE